MELLGETGVDGSEQVGAAVHQQDLPGGVRGAEQPQDGFRDVLGAAQSSRKSSSNSMPGSCLGSVTRGCDGARFVAPAQAAVEAQAWEPDH